jgi:hypothetical protein
MCWTCICKANHTGCLVMGDVCDACGERVIAAECVDYVIGYCIVTETAPAAAPYPPVVEEMHRSLDGTQPNNAQDVPVVKGEP